jgi:hypothetical protein
LGEERSDERNAGDLLPCSPNVGHGVAKGGFAIQTILATKGELIVFRHVSQFKCRNDRMIPIKED